MILSLSHINRQVRDLDRTIAFYTTHLGFRLLRRYRRAGRGQAAYIGLGDVLFELGVAPEGVALPRDPMEGRLGLTVTYLDALLAELQRHGVEVVEEAREMTTFWGRQAAIKDPDGYVIALREWSPPDGHTSPAGSPATTPCSGWTDAGRFPRASQSCRRRAAPSPYPLPERARDVAPTAASFAVPRVPRQL